MDYNTDRAITNIEDDLLGRASFSKQLGQAIYEYKGKDSLVIGLFGRWGTGKTSVINMSFQTIEQLAQDDEKKPLLVRFAPWNYSDKDNLIFLFFNELKAKVDADDSDKMRNKVGKALADYSGVFEAASLIPYVGSILAPILKSTAKAGGEYLAQGSDLDSLRKKLEKALLEVDRKIIVLIDDIDRLSNSQIRDIFQLVKQVADLPNIIYILAMDREVVKRALAEVHNTDGNEYLEKIIQIPFELPELSKVKLHSIFFNKLDGVIKNISDEIVWNQQYWNKVFSNCISPYLETLRDVNRVINTFQFRYSMLYQETAFEDMIALTTLEVLCPELYKWISGNKEAVCGGMMHGFLSGNKKADEYRKQYIAEFKELGVNPEIAIKSIAAIFPVFAKDVNENFYGYYQDTNIREQMRAAHEDRFDLYFMLDLDSVKVPRGIVNACVNELSGEDLEKVILGINEKGNIIYFLDELKSLIQRIPYERLAVIASALFNVQDMLCGQTSRAIFTISAKDCTEYCILDILARMNSDDERFRVIQNAVQKVSLEGVSLVAQFINRIELAYGRLAAENENKENQIITLEQLQELEKDYISWINKIDSVDELIQSPGFNMTFYLWECLDAESARHFMDDVLKDEVKTLRFIASMAGKWTGTTGAGWTIHPNNYNKYITEEKVYELVQSVVNDNFDAFTDDEKIKLASFFLNYKKHEMSHVTEEEAKKQVDMWNETAK